jgi:acylphosphatase
LKSRVRVTVSGRVQGVFFRSTTRDEAENRNISGWVKNLDDGRVEALFEGEKEAVEQLVDFCRKGPVNAVVRDVEVVWEDYKAEFTGFRILH